MHVHPLQLYTHTGHADLNKGSQDMRKRVLVFVLLCVSFVTGDKLCIFRLSGVQIH